MFIVYVMLLGISYLAGKATYLTFKHPEVYGDIGMVVIIFVDIMILMLDIGMIISYFRYS